MLAGLILAGGKSSRMGTDKSLLTLPGSQQSLLKHCHRQLALVCDDNVLISGSQHKQGIADVLPNCGPLSGIHAAITHIQRQQSNISELLVIAVDMPDLCSEDFNYLLKMGRKNHSLCSFEKCFLPLYIPLSNDVTGYLAKTLKQQTDDASIQSKQRKYSVKLMLNALRGVQIRPLKNAQLDNINTVLQWGKRCTEQPYNKARHDSD
jgi:molybdopterin-guanine dinucleotide biosynthesis protein A